MNNKIVYENKPYNATQNSTNTVNNKQDFVNMEDIKQDVNIPKYATLENDLWQLDGTFESFPDSPQGLGYISKIMSNEEGNFTQDIVLTRIYDNTYTSPRNNDNF